MPTVRAGSVGATVRSVLGQTWSDWELLVIGQGSSRDEAELRAAIATATGDQRVSYVHLERRGVSHARNAGCRLARGEILAFIDDDCEADPWWLEAIVRAFDSDPALGLVGGSLLRPGPVGLFASCPQVIPAEAVYDPSVTPGRPPAGWDWFGANVALRSSVAATIGLWDELLGGGALFGAAEDTDFKLRAEALGVRMLTTPRVRVVHSSGTRSGRAALRSQRNYAYGNGALAAKQTLIGNPLGTDWLRQTRRRCLTAWARRMRPDRLPVDLRHLLWFERGYRVCLQECEVDGAGLLRRRQAHTSGRTHPC